ncbi:MAG: HEAT repeat domain-containing protein [Planctomycetota bacterium]
MNPANSNLVLAAVDEAKPETDKPDPVEQAFQDVLQYEQGGTRKALAVLENHINQTYGDAPAREQIVGRLLGMLENPEVSPGCKNFACKKLMLLAGPESVLALAKLVGDDENLAVLGRYALEQMPQPEAAAALRDALGRTKGRVLIGVINSLGVRKDGQAVAVLVRLLADKDEAVAGAAAAALGKIGGNEATSALRAARSKATPEVRAEIRPALLACAESLFASGNKDEAKAIYGELSGEDEPEWIRATVKKAVAPPKAGP